MIKDLELMKEITPLFDKKLVIWGLGEQGHKFYDDIIHMGGGKKGIFLCDSDAFLQGKKVGRSTILSPKELGQILHNIELEDIAFLVTVASLKAQDEIISVIEKICGKFVDIYTAYAIEWGIYLGLRNSNMQSEFKKQKLIEHERNRESKESLIWEREKCLKYFAFLPLHNNEMILVFQPGKVASLALYKSIQNYNRNVLHCHILNGVEKKEGDLYQLANLKAAKIICLVRDPIARQIAVMWQNIQEMNRYSLEADFSEIEKYYFPDDFDGQEFQWFDGQMKKFFQIDVFEYPFDRYKGYSIIKKGNIELLLLKMERINELENIIGGFLGIEQFHLCRENVSEEKAYRFALREYKRCFSISQARLEEIYLNDERMKHFYTEEERSDLYMKWLHNSTVSRKG